MLDRVSISESSLPSPIEAWARMATPPDGGDDRLVGFIRDLGCALNRYGAPSHQIEAALVRTAARLGIDGQFFATPTAILGSLGGVAHPQILMVRTEPGEIDLEKLERLGEIIESIHEERLDLDTARRRVSEVIEAPCRYGAPLTVASFAASSASAARIFGGGLSEIIAGGLIGCFTGLLAIAITRGAAARLFEPVAATVAALVACLTAAIVGPLSIEIAVLSGLIVLIPGLTLTVAMNEIATRHLVAGTARLVGAFVTFLGIGVGVAVGARIGDMIIGPPVAHIPIALPGWTQAVALLVMPFVLTVLFRAHPRNAGWIMVAAVMSFLGARFGAHMLGPELGVFLGAMMVGSASNVFAHRLSRPASVTLIPGIMVLVPGSIGFSSMTSFLAKDVDGGIETAFTMLLIAGALVMGLLLANVIVPPRKSL